MRGGVATPLNGGEREARGTDADGRWHGCHRDGEGDRDGDRGCPECAESNGLTIAAWGQGTSHYIGCDHTGADAGGWTDGQPRCTIAGSPVQGTLTGIVDSQDLGRRAGRSLLSCKG